MKYLWWSNHWSSFCVKTRHLKRCASNTRHMAASHTCWNCFGSMTIWMEALIASDKVRDTPNANEKNQPKGEGMKDADDSPTTKKKKEKEKKIEVKKKMTLNLNHTKIQMNSNTTNNSTTDNNNYTTTTTKNNNKNIESHNKDKNHINTNTNTNTKMIMNKNKMQDEKDKKNKTNRKKDEKDKNDCTKKMNILKIHHTRWWSHLDQHHHHYLLLLSCLEHLFVSLSLFQRTLIILISFTFISTLAWPEASVAMKVKSINTNSVSDTSNDGNNCLNKKMKKTMNLKKNEPTVRELKKKSVVVDNWSLLCCCLTQVIQILIGLTLWSAWLIYSVDSRWWPLVTFLSVSKFYPRLYHITFKNFRKNFPKIFLEKKTFVCGTGYW